MPRVKTRLHRIGKWLVSFHCKDCGWAPVQLDSTCRHCGGHIVNVCHGEAPKRDA